MRVAYLTKQYPEVSHSFIRREILALERRGVDVMRIALVGWDTKLVDAIDEDERKRTRYVRRGGAIMLLFAFLRAAFTRPAGLMRAFALACRMGRRSEHPPSAHLVCLAEACRIVPWLEQAGIDHVHAYFGTDPTEVAMLVRVLDGPPFSFTVHGPEEFDKAQFIGLGEKIRRCMFAVAISAFGRSQLLRTVSHEYWSKVRVVHCGVDPGIAAEPSRPLPLARRLVCIGCLCEHHGQLLLIEAARRLVDAGTDFDLVLVGDGELRGEIESLVRRYKLRAHVRITGAISCEWLRDEVLSARALVLPSFATGLPGVLMEAMALGRPVISTYIAGIPELVVPGEHGWLVPAGDVDALVAAMQACLDAPVEALARMAAAARTRVLERHDLELEVGKLAALFEAVSQRSTSMPPQAQPIVAKVESAVPIESVARSEHLKPTGWSRDQGPGIGEIRM
jgi:colanic acid/amylovoran biosynthesis glycosyltransferase